MSSVVVVVGPGVDLAAPPFPVGGGVDVCDELVNQGPATGGGGL